MAKILVADDQITNRQFLLTLLGYGGHHLLEASDGVEALQLVQKDHPDLLIADILMPRMDGFELVRRLRAEPAIAGTPVIFWTAAYYEHEARALAERCGVQYLLIKPSDPEVVLNTVNAALGVSPAPVAPIESEEFHLEHLQLLANKLSQKLDVVIPRLNALIKLGQQLACEQDPSRLIEYFCGQVQEIVGAQVAAVGILHEGTLALRCFCASDTNAGRVLWEDLPTVEQGLLGRLSVENDPIRQAGLPEGTLAPHPAVRDFLGTPILSAAKRYGWLYLADKLDGDEFDEDDELLVMVLAAQFAVGYESAQRQKDVELAIVERIHAEAALRASESRYRAVVEDQTELVWRCRPDGTLTFVNESFCRYWEMLRAELIGHHFTPPILPDDAESAKQQVASLTWDNPVTTIEYRLALRDGEIRWHQVTHRALFDTEGNLTEIQAVGRDITERKRMEAQTLELALEHERVGLYQRFLGDVSHDLRTPLTAIRSSLYLLRHFMGTDRAEHHLNTLEAHTTHIERMVEDLLYMSELDKELTLQLELCDVSQMIEAVLIQQPAAEDKNHTLKREVAPGLPTIFADYDQLSRVLAQLVMNAINFTPPGGTITVQARQDGAHVLVAVRDTGIGISADDLPYIFERFYRADKARGTATGGAGLGLAICKKIVERHGGRIWAEAQPGKGSAFYFTVPLAKGGSR